MESVNRPPRMPVKTPHSADTHTRRMIVAKNLALQEVRRSVGSVGRCENCKEVRARKESSEGGWGKTPHSSGRHNRRTTAARH